MSAFKTETGRGGKRPKPLSKGTVGRIVPGGYTPKIAGRPVSAVEEIALPGSLHISLTRGGVKYLPVVKNGQKVEFGQALAEASAGGGTLRLPAPAAGTVALKNDAAGELVLKPAAGAARREIFKPVSPDRISAEKMRSVLADCGVWPFFTSTRTGGSPRLAGGEMPRAIVVNFVLAEPFRARGKVILQGAWEQVIQGIRFLPRLLADYGKVEIILTAVGDPVARRMYEELAGQAWIRLHSVPVRYPLENPRLIRRMLRKSIPGFGPEDSLWTIDGQGIQALGACLSEGLPLYRRLVALSGPGALKPRHLSVTIGTPISDILARNQVDGDVLVLRGGILTGVPVSPESSAVGYDDDAYFLLPAGRPREFLSFLRPGFTRASCVPVFASRLTGAADSHISNSLRGERRPCIACGLCEQVCPVDILPQVLHRYIYREAFDEAVKAGLDRCIGCNLCTYVCPSKIELQRQFAELSEQLKAELAEDGQAASPAEESDGGKR
jgi:Na(+)-translocating NADH:ubiquinone oxidoreductase A subunit